MGLEKQMNGPIPYGKHSITEKDIESVVEVLKSDYLTQGPTVAKFEDAFADYIGSKYAIAVSNGTTALHLCTTALNVQKNERVITTPITFAATGNCVRYQGGEVLFADIDSDTYLLDINSVRKILQNQSKTDRVTGIIPVDFAGRAVNLEGFRELADEFGLWIIEDACHAPGATFIDSNGDIERSGNGKFADLAIFSFHPVKHIAAGEGGMVTTNDENLYKRLLKLRSHGITKSQDHFIQSKSQAYGQPVENGSNDFPGWYMEMQELGYNYRLSDIQAALGLSQLKRAEVNLLRRREIANRYDDSFSNFEHIIGQSGYSEHHAYHLYIIEVDDRKELYQYLRSKNIFTQIHYVPLHLMPYYRQFGWKEGDFPHAENYYSRCISLPMYPTLSIEEQEYVIESIFDFYE